MRLGELELEKQCSVTQNVCRLRNSGMSSAMLWFWSARNEGQKWIHHKAMRGQEGILSTNKQPPIQPRL